MGTIAVCILLLAAMAGEHILFIGLLRCGLKMHDVMHRMCVVPAPAGP